jgi:hypothetical protein
VFGFAAEPKRGSQRHRAALALDQAPVFRPGASVRIEDGKLVSGTR